MGKIGILGGTFDPIHNGHLQMACQAYQEYGLDQVWFMPSGQPPHKQGRHITAGEMRREMVCLAIENTPYFLYSDFEQKCKGKTYTAQTLERLRQQYPEHFFYFMIGADSLYEIERWYHPRQVMEQTVLMVADRTYRAEHLRLDEQIASLEQAYGARILKLHGQKIDISSSCIREMAAQGKEIEAFVPRPVADYIYSHGLYGVGLQRTKEESEFNG